MKLINDRYRINKEIYSNFFVEAYEVEDILNNQDKKFLKIYDSNLQKDLIDYFIENQLKIRNIKHKNILESEEINIITTIDSENTNSSMYYTLSERIEYITVFDQLDQLNFHERLNILLDVIMTINFLHFRGITYKFLNPLQIALTDNNTVKLQSLFNIVEKTHNNEYTEFERTFLSPDFISKNEENDKELDYYSLARMIEYLFIDDDKILENPSVEWDKESATNFFRLKVEDLGNRDIKTKDVNLVRLAREIAQFFKLDYHYCLVKERDYLCLENQLVGRSEEIGEIMDLDTRVSNKLNHPNLIMLSGKNGMGKSRFLREIQYRLTLRNRSVFSTSIEKSSKDEMVHMAELLLQAMNGAPSFLKEKYSEEFAVILPNESSNSIKDGKLDDNYETRKYRIVNRMANYLKELAKGKTIYLLIDNIQNGNHGFFDLLEYLIKPLRNSNVICILAYDTDELDHNEALSQRIQEWKEDFNQLEVDLGRLDLEETGELVKNILGMGYIHWEFSSVLFKESNGKPKRIEELIEYLYTEGQLFMGENGKWVLNTDNFSDIYIPIKLDGHTIAKLGNLREDSYKILKTIAIFNDLLPKSILSMMLGQDKDIEPLLDELLQEKLIEKKIADWGYSYNISNTDVKKHIYYELEQSEKMLLHKKAIAAIEKLEGEVYESLFEELIYHLVKSMERDHALEIILEKIEALDNTHGSDAMYLLEKAYSIFAPDTNTDIKLEILHTIISNTLLKGDLRENDNLLEEYIQLADEINSTYHILCYIRFKAEIFNLRGNEELFLEQIEKIKRINADEGLVEFDVYCFAALASIDINRGSYEQAENNLKSGLELATKFNLTQQLGNIYNMLGNVKYYTGLHNEATGYYEKSYENFKAAKDVVRSVKPINNLGNIYVTHLNDAKKATAYYKRGLEISRIHGLKNMQLVFSLNIGEISKSNFEYEMALESLLEANKIAVELQDPKEIAICQSVIGSIYLETEKYDKAYECYVYVSSVMTDDESRSLELSIASYDFLGSFYFCMGEWDKALYYYHGSKKLFAQNDLRQYYKFKFKILLVEIFKNKRFDKAEVDKLAKEYGNTIYVEDYRHAVLIVAIISLKFNDMAYTKKYLTYDTKVPYDAEMSYLNDLKAYIETIINLNQGNLNQMSLKHENLERLVEGLEKDFSNEHFPYKTTIMSLAASGFEKQKEHKEALKLYMDALENIYKNIMKIPSWEIKIAYMKSRDTQKIKDDIIEILFKYYGVELDQLRLESIEEENFASLNRYFNFNRIIELIGIEEFSKIAQMGSFGEATEIMDIETLVSKFSMDYKYNLDLILNFISKEAFATNASIIEYNRETDEYEVVSTLHPEEKIHVNDGILKASTKTNQGLLVKAALDSSANMVYRNLLSKNVAAVICVPIDISDYALRIDNNRKSDEYSRKNVIGFIYLETNRVFSNFNENMMSCIKKISYLVYMNLEINRIGLMATTDKLTGAYTRKYYEEQFSELIENSRAVGDQFYVLMLDLDKFKDINDTFGHRKGDEVLRSVGEVVKANIRSTDIFGRYGGEELVVILKDANEDEALMIAEKIRKRIENLVIEGIKKPITISIGVSAYPAHSRFKEDLIEKADQALYHAKHTGRNKVFLWNPKMDGIFERVDKLAGILTGINEIDNKNILGIVQIVNLIEEDTDLPNKIFKYLGELLNIVDSEKATLIIHDSNQNQYFTRVKSDGDFSKTPSLNEKIISRVIHNKKGEFLIDWDNLEDFDKVSGIPNFKSVIAVPMVKNGEVKGITYLSSSLDHKEFDFNALNLTKNYAGIFTSLL